VAAQTANITALGELKYLLREQHRPDMLGGSRIITSGMQATKPQTHCITLQLLQLYTVGDVQLQAHSLCGYVQCFCTTDAFLGPAPASSTWFGHIRCKAVASSCCCT
jgi:hypothetical protein